MTIPYNYPPFKTDSNGNILVSISGGGSNAFSAITSGTNTSAAMVIGSGASLSTTGTGVIITPNIVGVTNGSNAAAGSVGEYIEGTRASGSAITLTNGQYADVANITIQGDFDVTITGIMSWSSEGALENPQFFIGTAAGNNNTGQDTARGSVYLADGGTSGLSLYLSGSVTTRLNPSSSTTYYLKVYNNFGTGVTAFGTISARRGR